MEKLIFALALIALAGSLLALPDYVPVMAFNSTGWNGSAYTVIFNVYTYNNGSESAGSSATNSTVGGNAFQNDVGPLFFSYASMYQHRAPCTTGQAVSAAETVDRFNNITESNENNNFVSTSAVCNGQQTLRPDEKIDLNLAWTYQLENGTVIYHVIATLRNNGTAGADFSSMRLIAPEGVSDYNTPPLGPGWSFPSDWDTFCQPQGSNFTMIADYPNIISESNESNNNATLALPPCPNGPLPDYISRIDLEWTGWNGTGNIAAFSVFTRNFGGDANATSITNSTINGIAAARVISALPQYSYHTYLRNVTCVPGQTIYASSQADRNNVIMEANELNNLFTTTALCQGWPDLADLTPSINYTAEALPNGSRIYHVLTTARNVGTALSPWTVTRLYSPYFDYNSVVNTPPLGAGSSFPLAMDVPCAATPTPFGAMMDYGNASVESNEDNNNATIILPPCPRNCIPSGQACGYGGLVTDRRNAPTLACCAGLSCIDGMCSQNVVIERIEGEDGKASGKDLPPAPPAQRASGILNSLGISLPDSILDEICRGR